MKIMKYHPDEEGVMRVPRCIATIWIGMQKDIPTMMCVVAEDEPLGKDLTFYIKEIGDMTDLTEMRQFACALVTADAEYFLFGDKPTIIQQPNGAGPAVPPSMTGKSFT